MRGQQYKKERKRRDPRGKAAKPFKRRVHVNGEEWSWHRPKAHPNSFSPTLPGIRIRSPDGRRTWEVPASVFVHDWTWKCPSREAGWCSGSCYGCSPEFSGPGYKPSLIRRYIEVVCIGGGVWEGTLAGDDPA